MLWIVANVGLIYALSFNNIKQIEGRRWPVIHRMIVSIEQLNDDLFTFYSAAWVNLIRWI